MEKTKKLAVGILAHVDAGNDNAGRRGNFI